MSKKHNCEIYHSKLKSKHTSLINKYKLSKTNVAKLIYFSLVLREQEKKITKYMAPYSFHIQKGPQENLGINLFRLMWISTLIKIF